MMGTDYSTPEPKGPYVTGCLDLMHGRSRSGTFLRLFYPTDLKDQKSHRSNYTPWFLGNEYTTGLSQVVFPKFPSFYSWLWNWQSSSFVVPSVWEAPVSKGQFPVVIFSHGFSGQRSMYSIVCNSLSSYGFIVACIEHRDGSAASTFTLSDSGEKIWHYCEKVPPGENEFDLRQKQIVVRVEECTRAFELITDLNEGKGVKNELPSTFDLTTLKGRFDMSKLVISGHSFGASTAIKSMAENPMYKICVALDTWMLPLKNEVDELASKIDKPILSILTESFLTTKNVDALKKLPKNHVSSILLKGTIHSGQSDAPYVLGILGQIVGGLASKLDRETTLAVNNDLIVNFICTQLGISAKVPTIDVNLLHEIGRFSLPFEDLNEEQVQDFLKNRKISLMDVPASKL